MGFYGMLLGVTLLFAAVLISNVSHRASALYGFSNSFDSYYNIQRVEMFRNIIDGTRVPANSTEYGNWLNSLYVGAKADGINISVSNGTMLISTDSRPSAYAILRNS